MAWTSGIEREASEKLQISVRYEELSIAVTTSRASVSPTETEIEGFVLDELSAFVREIKGPGGLARVRIDASLERDLGLGSLERMELVARLERRLGRKLSESALVSVASVGDLAAGLAAGVASGAADRGTRSSVVALHALEPPESAKTWGEVLARRASAEPDAPHILLETEDSGRTETLTYGELYRDALAVAGGLGHRGLADGEAVAIMLPTSRSFFSAFMGTLLAGGVPVPLYPPGNLSKIAEYAERQIGILRNAEARLFVTLERGRAVGRHLESAVPSLEGVVTVEALVDEASPAAPRSAEPHARALVQYTSGSTGEPKGVLLTHANLLANVRAIGRALEIGPSDVGVSWLPLYHDMGLIGAWLTPLYFGIPVSILSPLVFLARPERWLWTLHRRRGTISPAPNFAYEICRRKIPEEELEGLDLSAWRVALNGAEPISPATLEGFAEKFAPCGFRAEAFLPVYGLAEASLLLTAPRSGARFKTLTCAREPFEREGAVVDPDRRSEAAPLRFVSVGRPIPGHEVRIVDENGGELPERREGRLVFRGPSVTAGYFRNEAASAALRTWDGFLESGDRAFVADGEIYVTGRTKDLIIQAGRNLVPQELETIVSGVPGVRAGSVAAFGVPDESSGTERIVVLAERRDVPVEELARIRADVEAALVQAIGVAPDDVVLVEPRTLPKTSSGKLRRSACRERYLRGALAGTSAGSRALLVKLWIGDARVALARALSRAGRAGFGVYVALLSVGFAVPLWLAAILLPSRGLLRRTGRAASRLYLFATGARLTIEGREHLAGVDGPSIIVANHASYLDALPLMAALDVDHAFVVKREVFSWPLVGRFVRKLGHVPVERTNASESVSSTKAMLAALESGRSLVIFPEGTFTYATGIRPFKLGAFHLASLSGRPVVPIALVGTRRWLRDGKLVPRPGRLAVVFEAPRTVDRSFGDVVRAREETREAIAARAGEPRLELASATPAQMEYP